MAEENCTVEKIVPDSFRYYADGKQWRYKHLFAVNGGAFAIAKLIGESKQTVLGGLELWHLSLGMILFTAIMVVDIYSFGDMMHKKYSPTLFGPVGRVVLILLGLLMCVGWFLVARR